MTSEAIVKEIDYIAKGQAIWCAHCAMMGLESLATARYYVQGQYWRSGYPVCARCWQQARADGIDMVSSEPVTQPVIVAELRRLVEMIEVGSTPVRTQLVADSAIDPVARAQHFASTRD